MEAPKICGEDLKQFISLLESDFQIKSIKLEFWNLKDGTQKEQISIVLFKNDKEISIISSEYDICSYASRFHKILDLDTDKPKFAYISDPNKYFEIEKKIIDLLCNEIELPVILQKKLDSNVSVKNIKKVYYHLCEWIKSEKIFVKFPTKLSRIFFDIFVLFLKDDKIETEIIEKEKLDLQTISAFKKKAERYDIAVTFSAFFLSPKLGSTSGSVKEYDVYIGVVILDLKNGKPLAFNIFALDQILHQTKNTQATGLWESIKYIQEKTFSSDGTLKNYLPTPVRNPFFTPLPWIITTVLYEPLLEKITAPEQCLRITPAELFAYGLTEDPRKSPTLNFDRERQTAWIMLKLKSGEEDFLYQLRFDRSGGEPKLHIDLQIYSSTSKYDQVKLLAHVPIDLEDVWRLSEDLYLGFIASGAYDVNFDNIIGKDLFGFDRLIEKNQVSLYPLIIRTIIKPLQDWAIQNQDAIFLLLDIAKKKSIEKTERNKQLVKMLKEKELLRDEEVTVMGDIILIRMHILGKIKY